MKTVPIDTAPLRDRVQCKSLFPPPSCFSPLTSLSDFFLHSLFTSLSYSTTLPSLLPISHPSLCLIGLLFFLHPLLSVAFTCP